MRVVDRPGARPLVAADDHRGDAVVDAGLGAIDPHRATDKPAGEILEQIEGARERVVLRHRLEAGQVEAGQQLAQASFARSGAALAGDQDCRVAGIEQDQAAWRR